MNGNSIIADTNTILYLLDGNKRVSELLNEKHVFVSFITELELLGYKGITKEDKSKINQFLSECKIIGINKSIKENTLRIKQKKTVKLPDAIIAGTAMYLNLPVLTADKRFCNISDIDTIVIEL